MTSVIPLEELLRNVRTLATFPPALAMLNVAINNDEAPDKIAAIISSDSDLTARLLRLANSGYYGVSGEIDSPARAIATIGIKEVRHLALASNAISLFPGIDAELISVEQFWYHSLGCGIASRVIGSRNGNGEFAFTAGLLHDIGRLVIYLYMPGKALQILEETRRSQKHQYIVEQEILQYDHGTIGAALLKEWLFPQELVNSVKYHHDPALSPDSETPSHIVHLANLLVHSMNIGNSGTIFFPEIVEKDWESVGLSSKDSDSITDQIQSEYDSALALFSDLL
ncbi:MAG: HDOD domain-containing protein [Candidatus Marinimicrobia bacterium]|nr:HDOD domain-containing protein [Candidatus Neomarinimicrobiota bacterium]